MICGRAAKLIQPQQTVQLTADKGFYVLIFLLLTALSTRILAQEIPPLINYPATLYKAHNQNWSLTEGSDHIQFSANSDGLLEFDGSTWKLHQLPDRQIVRTILFDELPTTPVSSRAMGKAAGREYRIYAGGFGEFGYWKKEADGQLRYYSLSKNAHLASLKTEEIWHILKTPDYIYFQSFSKIYRYDGQHLTELRTNGNFMFLQYAQGRLLMPTIGKGIYQWTQGSFTLLPGTEQLSQSIISAILPVSGGRLLVTTTKNGLFLWERNRLTPWTIDISEELKRNIINRAIVLSRDSSIVFGTIQGGVYVVDKNGVSRYRISKENGLQNNTVLALAEDSRKQLWVGMDQGIDLIKMSSPIVSYQTSDNPLGSAYSAAVWRGNLYVGSNKGVFVKKWLSPGAFRPVAGLGGQTWSLNVFNDQLIVGHNDATYRIGENSIDKISDITGGWILLPVRSGKDTLLLQGSYTGLHVYRKNKNARWTYAYPVKGVPPVPIRQIVQNRDGQFWLGHAYKGLFLARLSANLDSIVNWKEFRAPAEIPSEFSIEINKWHNEIFVRSGNTFLKPDPQNRLKPAMPFVRTEEEPFKLRNGISGEWFKVFADHIDYYNKDSQYRMLDLPLVRNSETIVPLNRDYYFFCLDNGYALYNRRNPGSDAITDNATVVIRKVANLRDLAVTFPVTGKPSLPADVRAIRITYALPIYGQNVQYKYRLKGLSDQWSEWTDQNFVEFTNLESADYIFEVKTKLTSRVASYRFGIQPKWRETVLAKALFFILIALAVIGIVIFQEKRLARHRRRLIREQEEKLRQQRLSSERQIMQIQNEKLQTEIQSKSQQLSNVAINVVRKNEILEEIRDELKQVKAEMGQQLPNIHYQKLLHSIERNVAGKDDWVLFEQNFDEVHEQFFKRLRVASPTISPSELRLAACLRMNLSTKEMSPVLGISVRGVEIKRYRLRKKLGLGADANLVQYMMDI